MEDSEPKAMPNEDCLKAVQREKLAANLFNMYEQDRMCDLTIHCGNTKFKAHRCILAASSPYCHTLIQEMTDDSIAIPLQPPVIEAFLRYCYSGTMQFSQLKILDILIASYILQLKEIYACYTHYFSSVDPNEIFDIWKEQKKEKVIVDALLNICAENLEVFLQTNKIGSFSKELLQEILKIKSPVSSVLKLKTIMNWVKADKSTRKISSQELLLSLDSTELSQPMKSPSNDFSKCTVDELILNYELALMHQQTPETPTTKDKTKQCEKIENKEAPMLPPRPNSTPISEELDETIQVIPPTPPPRLPRTLVLEELKEKEAPPLPPKPPASPAQPPTIPPRKISNQNLESIKLPEPYLGIFAVTKTQTMMFQNYNINKSIWSSPEMLSLPLNYVLLPAIIAVDNQIFVLGGSDNKGYLSHVFSCKISEFSMQPLKGMNLPRVHCAVAFLNGYIYVLGGRNTTGWLSEVERYDPKTNAWENVASMSETKSALGVTSYGDYLYAIGGLRDEKTFCYLTEQYNPKTNQWTKLAPLLFGRYRFGIGAQNGFLFILGGTREIHENNEDDFIQYDISRNIWSILSCPNNFHDDQPCILTYNHILWAVSRRTFAIFSYDTSNSIWTKLETLSSASNWQYIKNVILYYN